MISIVVAYANGRVIGRGSVIPWHLSDDRRHFKRITSGHTVVMGRKTFESIGRPLPQRRNVVLTNDRAFEHPGVEVVHSVDEALALGDIFVMGGEEIYRAFLDKADRLYITEIELDVEGDIFFPEWDRAAFTLVWEQKGVVDEKNAFPHTFYLYERKY